MTPIKDHSILIEYREINSEPFLDLTIITKGIPQDKQTYSAQQRTLMFALIEKWLYEE